MIFMNWKYSLINCVLLVLASEYYNEKEYIRDYNEFLEEVKNGKN
jgi:WxcM-like, C-terminal